MIRFFNNIVLFFRSLIFSILMGVITFFYSFLCVFAHIFFPFRYRFAMIMAWNATMIWLLKVICKIDYRVDGLENIPKNRNGIVLSKHQSTWETFFLPKFFHDAAIILKKELLWVPFFGWGLAIINPIAIDRKNSASALDQILMQGKKCLDAGRWVLIFPEGTRIDYGKVGKYRIGGARLAASTGYPVIPVAHNAGKFWGRGSFLKTPGTVHVVIGPLIETQNKMPETIMLEAKTWIENTMLTL